MIQHHVLDLDLQLSLTLLMFWEMLKTIACNLEEFQVLEAI